MPFLVRHLLVCTLLLHTILAQTYTKCDPTNTTCPPTPGLQTPYYSIDFTQTTTQPTDWTAPSWCHVTYNTKNRRNGAELEFLNRYDSPQLYSNFYFLFGRIEFVVQAAPGPGIISDMMLLSEYLDELDWEFRGTLDTVVQTGWFGKGVTGLYNHSITPSITTPMTAFHTYAYDWTAERVNWEVDGKIVRTLWAKDCVGTANQYPQSPSKVMLGLWDAGDPDHYDPWSAGVTPIPPPKGGYSFFVKSVKIWNQMPAVCYRWGDRSGGWRSIEAVGDERLCGGEDQTTTAMMSSAHASSSLSSSAGVSRFSSTSASPGFVSHASSSSSSTMSSRPSSSLPSASILYPPRASASSSAARSTTSSVSSSRPFSSSKAASSQAASIGSPSGFYSTSGNPSTAATSKVSSSGAYSAIVRSSSLLSTPTTSSRSQSTVAISQSNQSSQTSLPSINPSTPKTSSIYGSSSTMRPGASSSAASTRVFSSNTIAITKPSSTAILSRFPTISSFSSMKAPSQTLSMVSSSTASLQSSQSSVNTTSAQVSGTSGSSTSKMSSGSPMIGSSKSSMTPYHSSISSPAARVQTSHGTAITPSPQSITSADTKTPSRSPGTPRSPVSLIRSPSGLLGFTNNYPSMTLSTKCPSSSSSTAAINSHATWSSENTTIHASALSMTRSFGKQSTIFSLRKQHSPSATGVSSGTISSASIIRRPTFSTQSHPLKSILPPGSGGYIRSSLSTGYSASNLYPSRFTGTSTGRGASRSSVSSRVSVGTAASSEAAKHANATSSMPATKKASLTSISTHTRMHHTASNASTGAFSATTYNFSSTESSTPTSQTSHPYPSPIPSSNPNNNYKTTIHPPKPPSTKPTTTNTTTATLQTTPSPFPSHRSSPMTKRLTTTGHGHHHASLHHQLNSTKISNVKSVANETKAPLLDHHTSVPVPSLNIAAETKPLLPSNASDTISSTAAAVPGDVSSSSSSSSSTMRSRTTTVAMEGPQPQPQHTSMSDSSSRLGVGDKSTGSLTSLGSDRANTTGNAGAVTNTFSASPKTIQSIMTVWALVCMVLSSLGTFPY